MNFLHNISLPHLALTFLRIGTIRNIIVILNSTSKLDNKEKFDFSWIELKHSWLFSGKIALYYSNGKLEGNFSYRRPNLVSDQLCILYSEMTWFALRYDLKKKNYDRSTVLFILYHNVYISVCPIDQF